MTWLLIAAALIWCPTYIGLRLHSSWTPPLPDVTVTITPDVSKFVAALTRTGAALNRLGMSAQAAADAMRRAAHAFNAIRDDSPTDCRTPDLETP